MHKNNPPRPRQKKIAAEEPDTPLKRRHKRRPRNYGIETYRPASSIFIRVFKVKPGWYVHDWYETEKGRDTAFATLDRKLEPARRGRGVKYRKINRDEIREGGSVR